MICRLYSVRRNERFRKITSQRARIYVDVRAHRDTHGYTQAGVLCLLAI